MPAKNVTYERHMFFSRDLKTNETIDEYVTALRELCSTCEFGTLTDSLIKDKLLQGIKDKAVKDRLLRTKGLDLVKAIDICKAAETTKSQLEKICATTSGFSIEEEKDDINYMKKTRKTFSTRKDSATSRPTSRHSSKGTSHTFGTSHVNSSPSSSKAETTKWMDENKFNKYPVCGKCDGRHPIKRCPAFGKRCLNCRLYNHYARYVKIQKSIILMKVIVLVMIIYL